MGALMILGTPPDQARRLPSDLAHRVVAAAQGSRPDVQAFLAGAIGADFAPLEATMTEKEWRRQLRRGKGKRRGA